MIFSVISATGCSKWLSRHDKAMKVLLQKINSEMIVIEININSLAYEKSLGLDQALVFST